MSIAATAKIALTAALTRLDDAAPCDLLIVNAGIERGPEPGAAAERPEDMARVIDVNLTGAALTAAILLPRMQAKHPDAKIELKRRSFVPGLKPEENEDATKLALEWTGGNRTYAVPYGTEAGIFRARGIPTVICGPGDISQAHQPNEFVARSQMDACDTFMTKMVRWAER